LDHYDHSYRVYLYIRFNISGQLIFPAMEERIVPIRMPPHPDWFWPREEEVKQPEINLTLPIDGVLEIPLDIPAGVKRVSIEVRDRYSRNRIITNVKVT